VLRRSTAMPISRMPSMASHASREAASSCCLTPLRGCIADQIVSLAARYRLPTVYPFRWFAEIGGLLSYGIDSDDMFRRAASYVDRILKGAQQADLPVQAPTKYELIVNLKTAKALGDDFRIPPVARRRCDRVSGSRCVRNGVISGPTQRTNRRYSIPSSAGSGQCNCLMFENAIVTGQRLRYLLRCIGNAVFNLIRIDAVSECWTVGGLSSRLVA
jgi:hypothetical protein